MNIEFCPICGEFLKDSPMLLELQSNDKYLAKVDMAGGYVKELMHKSTDTQVVGIKIVCGGCGIDVALHLTEEAIEEIIALLTTFMLDKEE